MLFWSVCALQTRLIWSNLFVWCSMISIFDHSCVCSITQKMFASPLGKRRHLVGPTHAKIRRDKTPNILLGALWLCKSRTVRHDGFIFRTKTWHSKIEPNRKTKTKRSEPVSCNFSSFFPPMKNLFPIRWSYAKKIDENKIRKLQSFFIL